jgi:hypothetical protein
MTVYQAEISTVSDAVRKAAAMLGEAYAERLDAWAATDGDQPFPVGRQGVVVSIIHDGECCKVGLQVVLLVRLRPVEEMDRRAAEGER